MRCSPVTSRLGFTMQAPGASQPITTHPMRPVISNTSVPFLFRRFTIPDILMIQPFNFPAIMVAISF